MSVTSVASGLVILHLSDLHFGNKNRFQEYDLADFGQKFSRAVEDARKELGWNRPVDLVVVSGDIAEVAKPREFEMGRAFLSALVEGLQLQPHRTIFVPGNHDFSWGQCKKVDEDKEMYEFDENEYKLRLNLDKFKFYREFLSAFYGLPDGTLDLTLLGGATLIDQSSEAYLRDFTIDGLPISFAALNTSEEETHKRPGGSLSRTQAKALMDIWSSGNYRNYLKVAVVHHNPISSPAENQRWTLEWLEEEVKAKKLQVTREWLGHYTADMAGFTGAGLLEQIVYDNEVHLILHGHHHNPTTPKLWPHKGDGNAPILSVGTFALRADQIPPEQPMTCQLIHLQREPNARLIAVPLEFDPNYRPENDIDKGQFRLNLKSGANYDRPLNSSTGWKKDINRTNPDIGAKSPILKPEITNFVKTYRNRTFGLHSSYDLKNLGVMPAVTQKTVAPQLDDLYLPLRLDKTFDPRKTNEGVNFDVSSLLAMLSTSSMKRPKRANPKSNKTIISPITVRLRSLAITGSAGAGKTTWMRFTFRRMREDERTVPFLIELRAIAKSWCDSSSGNINPRSIEDYLEDWIEKTVPEYRDAGIKVPELLGATGPWFPVILVDGWDELGDLGKVFREKLLGMMQQYPRLLVIASSRPYGTDRPSHSDGFDQLQVQPLNEEEISTFAQNFYGRCYQEDEATAKKQALVFAQALARAEDAKILAKTPLLLTMMLFINRSKRLPDKRHQLYEECLKSLLSERPGMQMDEGARLLPSQWCPANDSNPSRFQIVAKMAYELQTRFNDQSKREGDFTPIVAKRNDLKGYLPESWHDYQKEGFLLWLCGRAGVMVDDTDDNLSFAHLSFQEFLTAWHLNATHVAQIAKDRVSDLASSLRWWETLLLWVALLNDQDTSRAEELLQTISEGQDGNVLLTGMVLADGVGTEEQMRIWGAEFARQTSDNWINNVERCLRAWQSSRQSARQELLLAQLQSEADETNWVAWLRLDMVRQGIGAEASLLLRHPNSALQAPVAAMLFPHATPEQFAGTRAASGIGLFYPQYPECLLNFWPSARRSAGIVLQRLASNAKTRPELIAYLRSLQTVKQPNAKMHRDLNYIAESLIDKGILFRTGEVSSTESRRQISNLSELSYRNINNISMLNDLNPAFFDLALALTSDLENDAYINQTTHELSRVSNTRAYERSVIISKWEPSLLWFSLAVSDSMMLFNVSNMDLQEGVRFYPELYLISNAAKFYLGRNQNPALFFMRISDELSSKGCDPLWLALARQIAGVDSTEDTELLIDLASHPEKRPEPLSWGLKYTVRGDVLLADGTTVTLDELCDEAGVPPYPLIGGY